MESIGNVSCKYCGEDILSVAIKCKHCGSRLDRDDPDFGKAVDAVKNVAIEGSKNVFTPIWIIATVLFPIVGVVGSIYGFATNSEGSGKLLALTIGAWFFWVFIYF